MSAAPVAHERPAMELETAIAGLVLRDMDPEDAPAFVDLVSRNREHLMAGNGSVPPERIDDVVAWMCPRRERDFQPALWLNGELIGHLTVSHLSRTRGDTAALLAHAPNSWGIGYWIGAEYAGHGYVTDGCRALMDHARLRYGATDFYSGTFVGNEKSRGVLERLGFELYKTTDDFVSYRLLAARL